MSTQTITIKIKILPDEEQSKLLHAFREKYSLACNYVSEYVYESHVYSKKRLQPLFYRDIREKFNLNSQIVCSVFRTVSSKYVSLKSNHMDWTKIQFKPQCELVRNKDYSLTKDNCFSISTLQGRIKVPYINKHFEKYFDSDVYKFGTAVLFYKKGKWFLLIPITYEVEGCKEVTNIVGIDRGINFVVTTYDSKGKSKFIKGRSIKHRRKHFKNLREKLQRKHTAAARRRLKRIGKRENRWMNDVNHCISKALIQQNPQNTLFVFEDLTNIKEASKQICKKERSSHMSWAYYDLEKKLEYKAREKQDAVIKVDPSYTSQRCPICSHTEKSNRNKKKHTFICKSCGYTSNDDRIGAMNLYYLGKRILEKIKRDNVPLDGVLSITPNVGLSNINDVTNPLRVQLQASGFAGGS